MSARLAPWTRQVDAGRRTGFGLGGARRTAPPWLACWCLSVIVSALCGLLYSRGLGRAYTYDESVTVAHFVNTGSLLDPLRLQIVNNNHPLLSLLDHLILTMTGRHDELAMRLVPFVAAVADVAILTAVGVRKLGAVGGLTAGGLLGVNPFFAQQAQTARGYTLLLLATIVAAVVVLDPVQSRWRGMAYTIAVAVGVAAHAYVLLWLSAMRSFCGQEDGSTGGGLDG